MRSLGSRLSHLVAYALLVCGSAVQAQSTQSVTESATSIADELKALRQNHNRAIRSRDLDAMAALWAEDIQVTTSVGTAFSGRETYRALLAQEFARSEDVFYLRIPWDIKVSRVRPLAFEQGDWIGRWSSSEGPVEMQGTYSAMWRQENGQWLIRSELFVLIDCVGSGCATAQRPSLE